MPNQNDPTQNPNPVNQTAAPPVPPVIFPQSDLPPLPPEFSAIGGSDSAEQKVPSVDAPVFPTDQPVSQPIGSDAGSSAPPDISSVIPKAKKKFGGGRIIATILGILVLVGGVGAGLILTKQQQIFQPKAVDCGSVNCVSPRGVCCNTGCFPDGTTCAPDNTPIGDSTPPSGPNDCDRTGSTPFFCNCGVSGCDNFCFSGVPTGGCNTACDQRCGGHSTGAACPVPPVTCYYCPEGTDVSNGCSLNPNNIPSGVSYNYNGGVGCTISGSFCGWVQCDTGISRDEGGKFISRYDTSCSSTPPTETLTPIPTPTATPTTPPPVADCYTCSSNNQCVFDAGCMMSGIRCGGTSDTVTCSTPTAPSCITVKAYDNDTSWTFIPETQLPSLAVGATVNFCVSGNAASGTFDKAQFMINTVLKAEVITQTRTGSDDFCQSYTILSTDTTVSVKAKIHSSTGGWVGESI